MTKNNFRNSIEESDQRNYCCDGNNAEQMTCRKDTCQKEERNNKGKKQRNSKNSKPAVNQQKIIHSKSLHVKQKQKHSM